MCSALSLFVNIFIDIFLKCLYQSLNLKTWSWHYNTHVSGVKKEKLFEGKAGLLTYIRSGAIHLSLHLKQSGLMIKEIMRISHIASPIDGAFLSLPESGNDQLWFMFYRGRLFCRFLSILSYLFFGIVIGVGARLRTGIRLAAISLCFQFINVICTASFSFEFLWNFWSRPVLEWNLCTYGKH